MPTNCEICGFKHETNQPCPETKKCPSCGSVMLLHDRKTYCTDECKNSRREQNGKLVLAYLNDFMNQT